MKAAITCVCNGEEISVSSALKLRKKDKTSHFTCISCSEPVKPHRASDNIPAHFEHYERKSSCPHSDGKAEKDDTFSLDDKRAIEGYRKDQKILAGTRNRGLVHRCKGQAGYKCQACGFKLKHNGRYIIECHHKNPVGIGGARETSLDDLVCLCPTCHRIAHTRNVPLTVDEIKSARESKRNGNK